MSLGWSAVVKAGIESLDKLRDNYINNYYNRKSASNANAYNLMMWNMENEYNKPVNQMARLKEAGLNPNLVYGTLASSAAGSTKPAVPQNQSWGPIDLVGAYQDLRQRDAMTQQVQAQTRAIQHNWPVEVDLKSMSFNNELERNDILKYQKEQERLKTKALETTTPIMIDDATKTYHSKDWWRGWSNFWNNFVGTPIQSASPFVQAGASHLSWHRGD